MATKTYLATEDFKEALKVLRPPLTKPDGQVLLDHSLTSALDFSSWLSLKIENRLRDLEGWEAAAPIAIGSWGRGELCPGSDLDVVFCGDQKAVAQVVEKVEGLGMKFRYRVPEDLEDWTKGVEVLEVNAIFNAKAFTQEGAEKLQEQKDKIQKKSKSFRRQLLKAIMAERKSRAKRYDSIANFLEPNLKFGSGGLRDLQQGLMLSEWFPERFEGNDYSFKILEYYKCFFLLVRQKLHLNNSHDILTAPDQHEVAKWLGFANNMEFMKEVQRGLSRVSFHSDWMNERCQLSNKEFDKIENLEVKNWRELTSLIQKDSSLQAQAAIRKKLFWSKGLKKEKVTKLQKGQFLRKILDVKSAEEFTIASFRSQLVANLVPSFAKVSNLVQHDQYHRYSVGAHLLQAVREVKRIYEHPKQLGKLQFYGEKLKLKDWNILRWAALYHDIAKGQGGEHHKKGRSVAMRDLKAFGLSKGFVEEVVWLVENHLILSTAAFRKNPQSPQTWAELFSQGARGERLYRLAIFTVIDIRATNPDAWNTWKENLLCQLVDTLLNPTQERYYDFSEKLKQKGVLVPEVFIENLDADVVGQVSHNVLIKDFRDILAGKELKPLVIKDNKNRVWVRFHKAKDEKGLVMGFTQGLTNLGCNIRQAFVHTDEVMGVYDWFCVKTSKDPSILKKQLLHNNYIEKKYEVSFNNIDLISVEEKEWVFSFRAKDKKGLLLSALLALYHNDLEVSWAKVHTWGRQIEDIFGVVPKKEESSTQILKNLKRDLEKSELEIL